jgi:type I restriction enzyme R subunit
MEKNKCGSRYSLEVRERAVRMVFEHFAEFISDGKSADQIEFVTMVIEHLTRNGVIDPGSLYDSPFTDTSLDGPDGVFKGAEIENFFERARA